MNVEGTSIHNSTLATVDRNKTTELFKTNSSSFDDCGLAFGECVSTFVSTSSTNSSSSCCSSNSSSSTSVSKGLFTRAQNYQRNV